MQVLTAFDKNSVLVYLCKASPWSHGGQSRTEFAWDAKRTMFFSFKHILFIKQTYFSKQTKMTQRTNKQKKRKTYMEMPHCNTVALPVSIATYLMWKGLMVKSKLTFAIFSRRVHWWIVASESLYTVLTKLWLFCCLCPVCGWVKYFPQKLRQCKVG